MKTLTLCTAPVLAMLATAALALPDDPIRYGPDGNLVLPHALARRMAELHEQARAPIYDDNGRIALPQHLAGAHPDDFTHDHHGRVLHKRQAPGGVTYNSEGGIVLPNRLTLAADQAGGVTYNSEGGIVLPNRLAAAADTGGVTYNSNGGVVLPNRLAAAADTGVGALSGETVPMPYTMNRMAQADSGSNQGAAGLSGETVPMPYTMNRMAQADSGSNQGAAGLSGETVPMPYTMNRMAQADSGSNQGAAGLSGETVPMPYTMNRMAQADSGSNQGAAGLSGETVPMPYTMNRMAQGGSSSGLSGETVAMPYTKSKMAQSADNQGQGQVTYNSEGGIVLPNSLAAAANTAGGNGQYQQGGGSFFDAQAHVGICGKRVQNTDPVVALSVTKMGENRGSRKENCGKTVEVVGPNGDKVQAEIVDICNTCHEGDIDMSPAAFEKVARFTSMKTDVKWKFVS